VDPLWTQDRHDLANGCLITAKSFFTAFTMRALIKQECCRLISKNSHLEANKDIFYGRKKNVELKMCSNFAHFNQPPQHRKFVIHACVVCLPMHMVVTRTVKLCFFCNDILQSVNTVAHTWRKFHGV
jgi:hypothetical protein